jgi:hypothetical protein
MVQDLEDPRRIEPAMEGLAEREMLEGWLEFHRATMLLKAEGVDDHGRKARPVGTSKLSLHGLVRHMAEVERSWFRRVLQHEPDAPYIWYDPNLEDSEKGPSSQLLCARRWLPGSRQPRPAVGDDELTSSEEPCRR